MKQIKVSTKQRSYSILVDKNALSNLPGLLKKINIGSDAVLITTNNLKSLYEHKLKNILEKSCKSTLVLTIPDTEKSKNAKTALGLIEKITEFDTKKKIFFVAFGGGVVGDLTGFIAAIYKRGVPYIQVPTTLLAQIDSSIGGKTAVDTQFGKNLLGAFYQPSLVIADTDLLKTLPQRQIRAGLSEAVKYAAIKDPKLFDFFKKNIKDIKALKPYAINRIILDCASLKAKIVAMDEFDKKDVRIILNFGHTFGHAIEAASSYKISHGEAVAIGMVAACRLSNRLGLSKEKTSAEVTRLLDSIGLPTKIKGINATKILSSLRYDKKFAKGKNRFVLLEKIGKTKIAENVDEKILAEIVEGLYQPIKTSL